LALGLVPFSVISFLFFIGVLRNRLGEPEDQFLASVFLGKRAIIGCQLVRQGGGDGGSH